MLRSVVAWLSFCLAFGGLSVPADAQNANSGFAEIEPSLVRIWAFDAKHTPIAAGTGIVVASTDAASLVLTAGHVVAGAAAVTVQPPDKRETPAIVKERGTRGRDLALLSVPLGNLRPVTFAYRMRQADVGYDVAVAGFVEKDDHSVGARVREGIVSSLSRDGDVMELATITIEPGMSGAPVFDPTTGFVYGIVATSTENQLGGYAETGAFVVLPFLETQARISVREGNPLRQTALNAKPAERSAPASRPAPLRASAGTDANSIAVPAGTEVDVALDSALSSASAKAGDTFTFHALKNVVVGDRVVVAAGAQGQGEVATVESSGSNGHSGKLSIRYDWIMSVDGLKIALSATPQQNEGDAKKGASSTATIVTWALLGPVGLFAHNFVRGSDMTIQPTAKLVSYTDHTVHVSAVIVQSDVPAGFAK